MPSYFVPDATAPTFKRGARVDFPVALSGVVFGTVLPNEASDERVVFIGDLAISAAAYFVSSTAFYRICSPDGPFTTAVLSTPRLPSASRWIPEAAAKESRTFCSSVLGSTFLASSSFFWRALSSAFFCLSFSRRSYHPRFFVSSPSVTRGFTAVGF